MALWLLLNRLSVAGLRLTVSGLARGSLLHHLRVPLALGRLRIPLTGLALRLLLKGLSVATGPRLSHAHNWLTVTARLLLLPLALRSVRVPLTGLDRLLTRLWPLTRLLSRLRPLRLLRWFLLRSLTLQFLK